MEENTENEQHRNLFDDFRPSAAKRRRYLSSSSSSSDPDMSGGDDDWQPPAETGSSSDAMGNVSSSEEANEMNAEDRQAATETMVSKDGTVWYTEPTMPKKCPPQNIIRTTKKTTQVESPLQSTELFFTSDFLSVVVTNTNLEGARTAEAKKRQWTPTDETEIKALIGALLAIGSLTQSLVSLKTITDDVWGNPFVRSLFSYNRLMDLLVALRFDDKDLRSARREKDPLAPIRELWEMFEKQLKRHFTPGPHLTVDEQLVPFRGRCKFRIYIPNKPDKYGLKIYWLCDAETSYPLRGIPYLGKVGKLPEKDHGVNVVLNLVEPYHRTGRNITCDSFFTTLGLAKSLKQKGITCVGTVKKDKRFIPEMLRHEQIKKKELYTNKFAFQEDSMIVTYKSKKNKCVTILSSMHSTTNIEKPEKNKTEVVCFYNATKGGVDNMDQMAKQYTCKRKTRRWPLVFFFNMLDLSCLAAHIIFKENKPNDPLSHRNSRTDFIREVAGGLASAHLRRRSQIPTLSKDLKMTIQLTESRIFQQTLAQELASNNRAVRSTPSKHKQSSSKSNGKATPTKSLAATPVKAKSSTSKSKGKATPSKPTITEPASGKRKQQQRCVMCDWKRDKKVTTQCSKCNSFICGDHREFVCKKCLTTC